jgi:hypothetical protein
MDEIDPSEFMENVGGEEYEEIEWVQQYPEDLDMVDDIEAYFSVKRRPQWGMMPKQGEYTNDSPITRDLPSIDEDTLLNVIQPGLSHRRNGQGRR